jgi:hypothetical protein
VADQRREIDERDHMYHIIDRRRGLTDQTCVRSHSNRSAYLMLELRSFKYLDLMSGIAQSDGGCESGYSSANNTALKYTRFCGNHFEQRFFRRMMVRRVKLEILPPC